MKWTNNYDLQKWNELVEKINSYQLEAEPTSDGNKIFSDGLKMFNMASFKHTNKQENVNKMPVRDFKS